MTVLSSRGQRFLALASGIATPKADIDLIKQRLKQAIEISKKKE